ncbi:MAG: Uma2 family endonuclease [Sphingomonas sp.]|nr:Uma2 family endonuclease [Sphingomonas sp.]
MTAQDRIDLPGKYRLRIADYHLLDQAGVFKDFAKTELIHGEIVAVQAQYSPHSRVQTKLLAALSAACDRIGNPVEPWVELSVEIAPDTEVQPDIVVATELPAQGAMPVALVAIIVEVADSSIKADLGGKAQLYAAAGVAEYWVADVNAKVIHQLWAPEGGAFAQRREVAFGDRIGAMTVAGLVVLSVMTA